MVDELYVIARDSTTFVATPRIVQVWGEKAMTAAAAATGQ